MADKQIITAYITKYALTKGVQEKPVEWSDDFPHMIADRATGYVDYIHKPYWYTSKESALKHAEELREKKIKSLEKQIAKLKKLKF